MDGSPGAEAVCSRVRNQPTTAFNSLLPDPITHLVVSADFLSASRLPFHVMAARREIAASQGFGQVEIPKDSVLLLRICSPSPGAAGSGSSLPGHR